MKKLIILCLLLISTLAIGCGSSGGSSNPTATLTGPVITSIYPPNAGPETLITIYGSRFGLVQGSSILSYNGVTVTPNSWSDTQITVYLPLSAQTNKQFLINVAGVFSSPSTPVTFNSMKITGISPSSGGPGTQVIIYGQNFGSTRPAGTYVTFYDQSQTSITATANITNWTDSSITCTVPNLTVTQSSNIGVAVWANSTSYVSTSFNLIVPIINSVSPSIDNIGATIIINGQGFGQTQAQVNGYITIGGVSATGGIIWSDNTIQVKVPQINAAGVQAINIYVNGRTITNTNSSFSVATPLAQNYSPLQIGFGNQFTIYGNYFGSNTDFDGSNGLTRNVYIQNFGYVNPVNWTDTSISFTWPVANDLIGTKNLDVTINVGGLSTVIPAVKAD